MGQARTYFCAGYNQDGEMATNEDLRKYLRVVRTTEKIKKGGIIESDWEDPSENAALTSAKSEMLTVGLRSGRSLERRGRLGSLREGETEPGGCEEQEGHRDWATRQALVSRAETGKPGRGTPALVLPRVRACACV